MKLLKKIFIVLLFSSSAISAFSQIKSYVGIVRQQYFPEHIKYFENYRDELNKNGYTTYSKYVDSYLQGSFGSGFVYVDKDGSNYIVTNRHVVSQAATASIEFEDSETGAITKYENLKILLTDDEIDVAILAFDDNAKPFKKGLTLSTKSVTDGQEVWSAGFPGLGSSPVWQLGKGTVTNAKARIKDLLDPNISTIIQHSAQVDGGNSGGPLMISSSNGTSGYEVVGINTWKANYRDSTNFSIPASVIKNMLNNVQKNVTVAEDLKKLSDRTNQLSDSLKNLTSDFSVLTKFISYEMAAKEGPKEFESIIHFAPTKVRSTILDAFSYDPAEGLRYACAYQLWKAYSADLNNGVKYSVAEPKIVDSKATVDFTSAGEEVEKVTTSWIKEHGLWRISELSSDETEYENNKNLKKSYSKSVNNDSSDSYFESPEVEAYDKTLIFAGADLSINGEKTAFFLGADFFGRNTFFGYSLMLHRETVECLAEEVGFTVIGMGATLRVPIKMGQFALSPYGRFNANMGFGDSRIMLGYTAEASLLAMFNTDGSVHFGLGVGFKQLYLSQFMDMSLDTDSQKPDPFTNRSIALYGIISF